MPAIAPPESDLWLPTPAAGETWEPFTVHTHYFSLSVPEAELGMYMYLRYQPASLTSQGGIAIFRGNDNLELLDMAHHDYRITMGWPVVEGNTVTFDCGVVLDFLEPGKRVRVRYASHDGATTLDVIQTAVTPLLMRGSVTPVEDGKEHKMPHGGFDQIMHVVGELVLEGERFDVDCYALRDRSWSAIRPELPTEFPPIGCTPMYWGEHLILNEVSWEAPDSNPAWEGIYDVDPEAPTHMTGWAVVDGEVQDIVRVRRDVSEHHPLLHTPMKQTVEIELPGGRVHTFSGESIAMCTVMCWPNTTLRCGVYRWEDEAGNVTHDTYQEMYWTGAFQQEMRRRAARGVSSPGPVGQT